MIKPYCEFSDHELNARIADREYQKKCLIDMLSRDIPVSMRNDLSLELCMIRKDLDLLYTESNTRYRLKKCPVGFGSQVLLDELCEFEEEAIS